MADEIETEDTDSTGAGAEETETAAATMVEEVLKYLNNYFCDSRKIRTGTWAIVDGTISLDFLKDSQYFRICGSDLNDGVYQYPVEGLQDEVWWGTIWPLKIPPALLSLIEEIEAWVEKYGDTVAGPYTSESFGGYSYTKSSGDDGTVTSWEDVFETRLAGWRKL